jgi:microcystin-dependent protein
MGTPFLGEIRMFAGNFAPAGWAFCNGATVAVSENDALFNLIGTTYGGDGQATFYLPDLQSRVPLHAGNGFNVGDKGGTESVTLTTQQIPSHTHAFVATQDAGTNDSPAGAVLAQVSSSVLLYRDDAPTVSMSASAIVAAGGSQPHTNIQPYLCVNFIIALYGNYPQQ